MKLFIIKFM